MRPRSHPPSALTLHKRLSPAPDVKERNCPHSHALRVSAEKATRHRQREPRMDGRTKSAHCMVYTHEDAHIESREMSIEKAARGKAKFAD
mmetsp:Transcript_8232/g.20180  ORF Transcript_8232/g.20180 Transcript_8232/m.20180 type:complete len:90 (-) Transcript_8232:261-530(-)